MAGAAPQSGQPEGSMGILWIVAAVFVVLAVVWYVFKKAILGFYLHIKLWEIDYFLQFFTHALDDTRTYIQNILSPTAETISFQDMSDIGTAVGSYMRYPLIALTLIMAAIVFFSSSTRSFKRTYSMKTLAELEKTNWPQITPVIGLNLLKQDINKGPWAMAMTPMQFCKRNHLLEEYKPAPTENTLRRDWNRIEVKLKRGEANRIFIQQLGSLWPGIERAPAHVKALFAIFAARINADSKPAAALLAAISRSSGAGNKLDFSGADALLKKHAKTPAVEKIVNGHAYLLTVMAAMLKGARDDGVQASSDFLWLKPLDRRLWYTLNTVGRQTPFAEVAGPFAHWAAEREAGRKLIIPMVDEATNALELALTEIIYKPGEEQ